LGAKETPGHVLGSAVRAPGSLTLGGSSFFFSLSAGGFADGLPVHTVVYTWAGVARAPVCPERAHQAAGGLSLSRSGLLGGGCGENLLIFLV